MSEDLRQDLLRALRTHGEGPLFVPAERESLERTLAFVEACPNSFERSHPAGHVTGSAFVVDAEEKRVVLLHHRKLGKWLQPGGHADGDPNVARVARREAMEETGLPDLIFGVHGIFDVDVHAIPARPSEAAHFHYDVRFFLKAPKNAELRANHESRGLAWVAPEEVIRYTNEPSILRMVEKWRGKLAATR